VNPDRLVLFDGVCNFCNYWVNFAIKRDPAARLKFTSLQGESAKAILDQYGIKTTDLSSVIFIDKGKIYLQSSAALHIARHLQSPWKLSYGLIIIPRFIRDFFYNLLARNRYKWFGKKDQCMVPGANVRNRFLD
jgi:predicted DCC family thiol-disulfide oxidoreductase YuxK